MTFPLPPAPDLPAPRSQALDSLRGIAILAVLCSHLLGTVGLSRDLAGAVVDLGRGGVTLFFLLSGYLIFRNIQLQPPGVFLCRRFFKVMPAYWLNIAVIWLADRYLAGVGHFPLKSYLACLFALSDIVGIDAVSGVLWTLLIEIKFYIFLALQYVLVRRRHLHGVLAALIALEIAVWAIRGRGSLTLAYFPVFYLGIEISLAESAGWSRKAVTRLLLVALLLAASLYLCLDQQKIGSALSIPAAAGLFILFLRRRLSARLLTFFGLTSYSTYLYHSLFAGFVLAHFGAPQGMAGVAGSLLLALAVASFLGALLYRMVEVPMVDLGRRLLARA